MGKQLTPRQRQALLKPCPTVAHVCSEDLRRAVGDLSTVLYVGPENGRICWCASVAKIIDGHPVALENLSLGQRRDMESAAREMLYLRVGGSVGKGKHYLAPGKYAVNIFREVTADERNEMPADWQRQPTDDEIGRMRR